MLRNWLLALITSGAILTALPNAHAAIVAIDINSIRGGQVDGSPSPTSSLFSAFDADNAGGSPQSATISGHLITLSTLGGAAFQTRDRQGVNGATFPNPPDAVADLYRDSIQADGGTNGSAGMKVQVDNLSANTTYHLTLWTHDVFDNGAGDGLTIQDVNNANATIGGGTFPGTPQVPTDFATSRHNVFATTDGSGALNVNLLHTGNGGGGAFIVGALPLNGLIVSSTTLSVDINSNRSSGQPDGNPSPTAPGFSAFDARDTNNGGSASQQSQFIDGHQVTLTALGGAVFQTRDRQGVNGATFPSPPDTVGDLYRDGIQADGGTNGSAGMQLDIEGLDANAQYALTLWTHEVFENGTSTDTVTINDVNTSTFLASGVYPGSPQVPSDFSTSRFDVVASSDANGLLSVELLHSWTGGSAVVGALALNGFQLDLIPVPEPSSLAMFTCASFGLLGGVRRRRKRGA